MDLFETPPERNNEERPKELITQHSTLKKKKKKKTYWGAVEMDESMGSLFLCKDEHGK